MGIQSMSDMGVSQAERQHIQNLIESNQKKSKQISQNQRSSPVQNIVYKTPGKSKGTLMKNAFDY